MKLNYMQSGASIDDIKSVLNYLINHSSIPNENEGYVDSFYHEWNNYLSNFKSKPRYDSQLIVYGEFFPLEYFISDYEIYMYFDINRINELIKSKVLSTEDVSLNSIKQNLHHTDTGCEVPRGKNQKPVLAVFMPTQEKMKTNTMAVIDGNHRVTTALSTNVDISVFCINDLFIPFEAFADDYSWIFYHILTGFPLVSGTLVDNPTPEDYLPGLIEFLKNNPSV